MNQNFIGKWRFTEMEGYDLDPSDPGFIAFDDKENGEFFFDATNGYMICGHGQNIVHFKWEGGTEGDDIHGDGWAELDEDNACAITGCIEFSYGDEIEFRAVKHDTKNT